MQSLIDQARGLNVTQTPENLALAEAMATAPPSFLIRNMQMPGLCWQWCATPVGQCSRASRHRIGVTPNSRWSARLRSIQKMHRRARCRPTPPSATRAVGAGLMRAQEAVALAPNHGGVNARLGFIYLALGRFADAIATYEHVLTLDPLAPPARYHHALTLMAGDRLNESRRAIDDGRRSPGESAFYFDTLCTWLELTGEYAQSLRTAGTRCNAFPQRPSSPFTPGMPRPV